jgi:hypothetical protein
MGTIFDKWNKSIDVAGLQKDIAGADQQNGSGDYKEVPDGTYEVKIEKIELKASSKGDPMVCMWFRILSGDFKNSMIFMNQVVTQGFQISQLNRFLKSLQAVDDDQIEFKDYSQYNDLLMDIFEEVDGTLEFLLNYGTNKKGFHTYKIEDVYEA